jgi:hypothetical protein
VDPEAAGRYLLGVECDGANYHRAKTARDRDKLREAVLRDLGWELHRIWSTDWWTNPGREIDKLDAALKRASQRRDASDTSLNEQEAKTERADLFAGSVLATSLPPEPNASSPPEHQLDIYQPISTDQQFGSYKDFYESYSSRQISGRIAEVVRGEGPISIGLAARRVASAWGIRRVHERAIERIRGLISKNEVRVQITPDGEFLWPVEMVPADYEGFRVPGPAGAGERQPEDIPLEEIRNAALYLLERHISAPRKELAREIARLFGFHRTGNVVEERMQKGIANLIKSGKALLEDEMITLVLPTHE